MRTARACALLLGFTSLVLASAACSSEPPPALPSTTSSFDAQEKDEDEDDEGTKKAKKKKKKEKEEESSSEDEPKEEKSEDETESEKIPTPANEFTEEEKKSGDALSDPWFNLLHSSKVDSCHKEGKVFDRNTGGKGTAASCHASAKWPSTYPCTKEGIVAEFKSAPEINNYVNTWLSNGFKIDQCGTKPNGKPLVYFIKKSGSQAAPTLELQHAELP